MPLVAPDVMWEAVDTHNDSWAYAANDHNWKSTREIISRLTRTAALGGNYMLNVGPTGTGIIPGQSAAILREVGPWVARNAESLYGTKRSPLANQAWGCTTMRPGKLYLHVLNWPSGGTLWVPGLQAQISGARFLAIGESVPHAWQDGHLRLAIPQVPPDSPAVVIELEVVGAMAAEAADVFLHEGLANDLHALFATAEGCSHARRGWMEKFGDFRHYDVLEGWQTGSAANWHLVTPAGGSYYVWMSYECLPEADGSELELSVGDTRWTFPIHATTGGRMPRTRLREERLGLVTLPGPGQYTLSVRGLCVGGENAVVLERLALAPE